MSNTKKGLFFGMLVGISWGLDTVLMGLVGTIDPILAQSSSSSSLLVAFLHDFFCLFWLVLVMVCLRKVQSTLSLLKTKKGKAACIAALIGAPIGMSGFVLGIKYAAPAYASAISVVYPGVGAILAYFLLKEKLSPKAILGIFISLIGSVALGYSKVDINEYPHFYLGIAFTCVAVIGWALEGVILAYAMKKITDESDIEAQPIQFLMLRYITSVFAYGIIIMPIVQGYAIIPNLETTTLLFFPCIAILGVLTYLSWYKAVNYVGAGMGTALNSTASFWALIFSYFILKKNITPYLSFCSLIIIIGVFIFALSSKTETRSE